MPNQWSFECYKDHKGNVIVYNWIKNLSKKAKYNALRAIEILTKQPKENWHKPFPASKIKGYNHIYVIRFNDENRTQWRIYGFHDDNKNKFIMTNYGTERDGVYKPTSAECAAKSIQCMDECHTDWDKHVCRCISTSMQNINSFAITDQCPDQ